MNEPIELTQAQRREVVRQYNVAHSHEPWCPTPNALQKIVDIINHVRAGDPVGIVRRDPRTGTIAVRVARYDGRSQDSHLHLEPCWSWVDGDGVPHHTGTDDCISAREIATWPVIYRPGGGS